MPNRPAAEPMIRQLPPVPAQKASSSQKSPSARKRASAGGALMRSPLYTLGMLYYALRDRL